MVGDVPVLVLFKDSPEEDYHDDVPDQGVPLYIIHAMNCDLRLGHDLLNSCFPSPKFQ